MHEIIDNFISVLDFEQLEDCIMPHGYTTRPSSAHVQQNTVPWYYVNEIVSTEELEHLKEVTDIEKLESINDKLFQHIFLAGIGQSDFLQVLAPLLGVINPLALFRIVANFTLQQKENRRSLFHIDADKERKPKTTTMTTSIFYMNSTNGPTILEDGTEIECRANRLVTFPYDTQHAAVLCTDQPYRVVINLNYFK